MSSANPRDAGMAYDPPSDTFYDPRRGFEPERQRTGIVVPMKCPEICSDLDWLATALHNRNQHFYKDIETGEPLPDDVLQRLVRHMLMVSEIAEMTEGVRKNIQDAHLPQFTSEEVEMADLLIRAFDYAGWRRLRLGEAFWAKLEYNRTRQDHTDEARRSQFGKKI